MEKIQRLGGKWSTKRTADETYVSAVIADFHSTDAMLDDLLRDLKSWRDSWQTILKSQADISSSFTTLYQPVEPVSESAKHRNPAVTPEHYLQKCQAMEEVYIHIQADLAQEITQITEKVMGPVETAKLAAKKLHKTLKHRENLKLDFERYMSKVENARKKDLKSPKETDALAKHENDLAQAEIHYQTADDHIKQNFPPFNAAVKRLFPPMLANQVMIQTTLVGQLYTVLDAYCREQGLPSPAPNEAEIMSLWESEFTSLRKELETGLKIVSRGKVVHQAMDIPSEDALSKTGLGIRKKIAPPRAGSSLSVPQSNIYSNRPGSSGIRSPSAVDEPAPLKPPRPGKQFVQPPFSYDGEEEAPPRKPPRPDAMAFPNAYPSAPLQPTPRSPSNFLGSSYDQNRTAIIPYGSARSSSNHTDLPTLGSMTPSSQYATPPTSPSPASLIATLGPPYTPNSTDQNRRRSSATSSVVSTGSKKPPPPIPVKRFPSEQFVLALYDYDGQSEGDLSFCEGDRIKVLKKTGSMDDWWDGELKGRKGQFPANYVRL